jgi:hypothetical protein
MHVNPFHLENAEEEGRKIELIRRQKEEIETMG